VWAINDGLIRVDKDETYTDNVKYMDESADRDYHIAAFQTDTVFKQIFNTTIRSQ